MDPNEQNTSQGAGAGEEGTQGEPIAQGAAEQEIETYEDALVDTTSPRRETRLTLRQRKQPQWLLQGRGNEEED